MKKEEAKPDFTLILLPITKLFAVAQIFINGSKYPNRNLFF